MRDDRFSALRQGGRSVALAVETCGARVLDVTYPAGTDFDTHVHEEAYLCLVTGGAFDEWCESGQSRGVEAGRVQIYHEGSRHAVRTRAQGVRILHVTDPSGRAWSGGPGPLAAGTLWQLATALARLDVGRDDADLMQIESLIVELQFDPAPTDDLSWLERVRARLRDEHSGPLSLRALAQAVDRHPAHVVRAFNARWGMTPGEYLRRVRVASAIQRLRETTDPLAAIAFQSGFADQSHMGRWLRRYAGLTPGAVRNGS